MTTTETKPVVWDWHSWGTTDDNGNYVTFRELAVQRKENARHTIADQLGETQLAPRELIGICVRQLGTTLCLELLQEVLELEQNGGMMLPDNSRRRTPGGVYLHIVKTRYPDMRRHLQKDFPKRPKIVQPAPTPQAKAKNKPAQKPKEQQQKKEKGTSVKLTLVGRPSSRVVDRGTFYMLVMQVATTPALPKGLPAPTDTKTNYVVSVSSRQWKSVADALDDPEDSLIIEGFPQVDAKNGSIVVYSTSITSKKLQAAKRASMKQEGQAS